VRLGGSGGMRLSKLAGRVAIITGTGRDGNIGQAACAAFLEAGAAGVVASDLRDDQAAALTARFGAERFAFVKHDVASLDDWQRVLAVALDRFGGLDVLVNNAGIGKSGTSATLALEDFRQAMDVNLYGAFLGTKVCAPAIAERARAREGTGAIVNVSSMAAYMPNASNIAYHCSKAALRMLTMCTSKELGPAIRVNSVHPGPIVTPLLASAFRRYAEAGMYASAEDAEQRISASSALGRTGRPDELARMLVYLASDDSSYVTGAAVAHDGGVGTQF
jgi:NAD(P)-dependent dehydrogenase (short-subunit alcohol dehydrogenase family)